MELITSSCFLSSRALALEGLVQEVPAGIGSCLGTRVNSAAVVPTQESWVMVTQGTWWLHAWWKHIVHALVGPSPRPMCDTCPAQQSWGFVLIRCLWNMHESAEAPAQHQALQEQILLKTRTFPAAPEAEAPIALRITRALLGMMTCMVQRVCCSPFWCSKYTRVRAINSLLVNIL